MFREHELTRLCLDDVIYTALELANEVSSHTFPAPPEKPSFLSALPTLPPGSTPTADMLLSTFRSREIRVFAY